MKKFAHTILLASAISAASFVSVIPIKAQTSAVPVLFIPLTNNEVFPFTNLLEFTDTLPQGFTNTLVQPTNLSLLQLTNVVSIFLTLQTNIEATLPILGVLTSNGTVTLSSTATAVPLTQAPVGIFLPPTGQVTNQQPPVISMSLGTNVIEIDPRTFQALVQLRDDLEEALPVLQMLNGTAPSQTNTSTALPTVTTNTPARNFGFSPLTRGFPPPLTRGFPPPMTNGSPTLSPF